MSLYENIKNKKEKISVIGLGYVGLPLAVAFSKKAEVVGFDIDERKVESYKQGIDVTKEVGNEDLRRSNVFFTYDESQLRNCKFHVIAVPTPFSLDRRPDLNPLISATKTVARNLERGSIIVYESTVYPGVTEEICIPIIEEISKLKCGVDFKIGYSPERINPGDKINRLETIVKVVSGMDEESLETIANIYEMIVPAGIYRAESIKVAESAKVIENSQRDINIAFMNEISIILDRLNIDTKAVLEAARTKWNFLKFEPGLVGGHCIGVDPYYLTYKAEQTGYHPQMILTGRRLNDNMGKYVAENTVKYLIKANKQIKNAKIAIMGFAFKENCVDTRNTKVIDIIKELEEYGADLMVVDPVVNSDEVWEEYKIKLYDIKDVKNMDAVVFAVPHKEFYKMSLDKIKQFYKNKSIIHQGLMGEVAITSEQNIKTDINVLIDVKGIFNRNEALAKNYLYWRL